MENTPAVKLMNKAEATEAVGKINNNVLSAAALIRDFYNRDGWKALGYKSWTDCASKEFEHSKQRVFQLLDAATLIEEHPAVATMVAGGSTERAVRELQGVPGDRIPEVVAKASAIASRRGHESPTAEDVQDAAAPTKEKAKKAKSSVKVTKAKNDMTSPAYVNAIKRIEDICGRPARKAIETGTVKLSAKDVILFAAQRDNVMGDIEPLILTSGFTVKKAIAFTNKMVGTGTKVSDLINHCIAGDGIWEGTVNGYVITVEATKKKR